MNLLSIIRKALQRNNKSQRHSPNTHRLLGRAPRRPANLAYILFNILCYHVFPQSIHEVEIRTLLWHRHFQRIKGLPTMRYILTFLAFCLLMKHSIEHVDKRTVFLCECILPGLERPVNQFLLRSGGRRAQNSHIHVLTSSFMNRLKQE